MHTLKKHETLHSCCIIYNRRANFIAAVIVRIQYFDWMCEPRWSMMATL